MRIVAGIVLATFFSDVGHEMVTAVLPFYLASVGLGAAALGVMEGLADLLFSISKLAGGLVGHEAKRKNPWATAGYLTTTAGTGAMALFTTVVPLIVLRAVAWFGRGFRSPLRDYLLADAVLPSHFGRAYGIERGADMLGAVAGPLVAVAFLGAGVDYRVVILVSIVPSALSVLFIFTMAKDRPEPEGARSDEVAPDGERPKLPKVFWLFVAGVLLFGLGDFSRTFLIFVASHTFAAEGAGEATTGTATTAVLLYVMHNAVSAVAALVVGRLADRASKLAILIAGYALGAMTNGMLAVAGTTPAFLVGAIALSGIYIAIEETIEKAATAEMLPRELRSLGFGILASANAIGDMASSVYVGVMLDRGALGWAFGLPATLGVAGTLWMLVLGRRLRTSA